MKATRESALDWLLGVAQRAMDRLVGSPPKPVRRAKQPPADVPEHADERTFRRIAEAQDGGTSTHEGVARYERGDNPGGLHHQAVRREGPERPRPSLEEPQERKATVRHGEKHLPVRRRG